MAAAIATVTVSDYNLIWSDGKMMHYLGSLAITASPATYSTGGIACNLANSLVKSQRAPKIVRVYSQNGLIYAFVPGSNVTNGTLKLFSALGVEVGDGVAIPAGNSGDTISVEMIFLGQN